MAKRKDDKSRRRKKPSDEKRQAIYAKSRQEFTAADLQKYTVNEKGIPLEKIIAKLEAIQRNHKPRKA